jgi:hypothetical protein
MMWEKDLQTVKVKNWKKSVLNRDLWKTILVEIKCVYMTVVTQLYFQIVEEINEIFRPFSGWAIIRLKLEYRRKLIHYTSVWVFSNILVSTWWWHSQKRAETYSLFLQQFENTVVLRRPYTHLISTSIGSHNGDDATKDGEQLWSDQDSFTVVASIKKNILMLRSQWCL